LLRFEVKSNIAIKARHIYAWAAETDMAETTIIPVLSSDGKEAFRVEARALGGRQKVSALSSIRDEEFKKRVESVARSVADILQKISPTKATAEFSIEVAVESGELTALLVKGSGTANLKVTLEWEGAKADTTGNDVNISGGHVSKIG
jgi:hypothetical protein